MLALEVLSADRYTCPEPEGDSLVDICILCDQPLTVEDPANPDGDPLHVFCDLCEQAEHPADMTPDWNGETGCHRSCEAAVDASEAPILMDFDLDWSRLTIGDVEVIEDALRSMLIEHEATLSEGYSSALIATLGRVEKVARAKPVTA